MSPKSARNLTLTLELSENKTIIIWRLGRGKEICTLTGHSEIVFSVAFSPEKQMLVNGSNDKTAIIWRGY
ncbi:hypothetical protein H6F82_16870 [Coleofasciculus sp. FACHB-SPT9]|nr:hypothetical protein [Coleofasciculus sp. FACHB-SPT9]